MVPEGEESKHAEAALDGAFPNHRTAKSTKNHPGFCTNLANYVTEYTQTTSLHGVRYLGERQRTLFEKLWWFCVFVISLYCCIALILKTYNKWDSSPVIVSFAQSPTPVWQIPFPAVTVCPETKSRQTIFNFTYFYHEMLSENNTMTPEEIKKYSEVALLCDSHLYNEGDNVTDYSLIDFLSTVAPNFEDTIWSCNWSNLNESCYNLFTPTLTEEGVCYTFNMLDRDDIYTNDVFHNKDFLKHDIDANGWTLEGGYRPNAGKDTFPRRAMSAGQAAGMSILMREYKQDLDYLCKGPVQGFKILLHHPAEVPRMATQYFRAPLNQELVVTIKPDMMTTSDSLRSYEPHRRQCYFSSERQLRFFKNYTQLSCDVECLANFTLMSCGCVHYAMPHELLGREVTKGLASYNTPRNESEILECDCLPACTSLSYAVEMSQADFAWKEVFQAYKANMSEFPGYMPDAYHLLSPITKLISSVQMTRVTIFFKEMQFITSTRNELYGLTDFLANCGGLLGLFIGFSFLSAIEIFYFLTFRVCCNMKRHGRRYWSGSPNLIQNDQYDYDK